MCVLTCRLNEAQQSAFQDITNVANERRQLSDELESLRSQFKAYQRVKTREISSLDHRVRILLQSHAVAGTMRPDQTPLTSSSPRQRPLPSRYMLFCLSFGDYNAVHHREVRANDSLCLPGLPGSLL